MMTATCSSWSGCDSNPRVTVLLDISMDGISGEDICRELKHHKKTSSIPVVLFSANDDIEEAARACGADDYMPKPFSIDLMKAKLSRIVMAGR
ncbi:MAG: response regulator [Chitinophagaceae bacterium]|nr:MAG: response regulator [Chitinophagaceae bacterium]